jgi:hypothetical protein
MLGLLESPGRVHVAKYPILEKPKATRKPRLKQNNLANIEERTLADIIDDKISGKPTFTEVSIFLLSWFFDEPCLRCNHPYLT